MQMKESDEPNWRGALEVIQWGAIVILGALLVAIGSLANSLDVTSRALSIRVANLEHTLSRLPTQPARAFATYTFSAPSATATRPTLTLTPLASPVPRITGVPDTPDAPDTLLPATYTGLPRITPKSTLNIRTGPGTNYPRIGTLTAGVAIPVIGMNAAETWYVINVDDGIGWVYGGQDLVTFSGDVADLRVIDPPVLPASTKPPKALAPTAPPNALPGACPQNCTACVAAGWTASQCGQCSNLDRDKDGVACYGD